MVSVTSAVRCFWMRALVSSAVSGSLAFSAANTGAASTRAAPPMRSAKAAAAIAGLIVDISGSFAIGKRRG
jgi:hypothetical protein